DVLVPQVKDSLCDCPLASTTVISESGDCQVVLSPLRSVRATLMHSLPALGFRNSLPVETLRLKLLTVTDCFASLVMVCPTVNGGRALDAAPGAEPLSEHELAVSTKNITMAIP